ncbi:MAG: peptidyl-prolyl cis-trans isomerase [Nevskiales bacterium]
MQLSATDIQKVRADWSGETGRTPNTAQLHASLSQRLDEEVLLREALRLKLDETDPVARERLLMNMRFAFPDTENDEAGLMREAQRLGMNTRDTVVRRRLIQVMEARIASSASIDETALREFFAQHPERYVTPARIAFRHVFLNNDIHGSEAVDEARALLERLRVHPELVGSMGDPFLLGGQFAPQTVEEIARVFGRDFAQAIAHLPTQQWAGPIQSAYGQHLIWVERIAAAAPADFDAIRTQLAYASLPQHEARTLRDELKRLRRHYRAELAPAAAMEGLQR